MGREIPGLAKYYNWDEFEKYCANNGIGCDEEDWWPWWDCWKKGYDTAHNDLDEE